LHSVGTIGQTCLANLSKTTKLILLDSLLQEIGDACLPPPPCEVNQAAGLSDRHLMHKEKWRIKWLTENEHVSSEQPRATEQRAAASDGEQRQLLSSEQLSGRE
jgi:hypothetical protein